MVLGAALTAAAFVANIVPLISASHLTARDTASNPSSFSSQTFDYIVVGGGTAGLTLASKLAESARVGIIEAGEYFPDDPLIDVPKNFGQNNGNPKYDWRFNTTPQAMLNGRVVPHPRGKVVGGSTALNYLVFNRGSKTEYDSWSEIGNDGWSWDQLTPSFKAVSNYTSITDNTTFPNADTPANANSQQQNYLGTDGPIHASYNSYATDLQQPYVLTMNAMGISTNSAPQSGNATGIYNSPTAVDRATGKRSYAASFYTKNMNNTNFVLLTRAQATKIEFSPDKKDGNVVATGVTFSVDGSSYTVKANKEIILSAGVFQSPQLLELSGIGNSTILQQFGINPLVDLPGVGENMQDHAMSTQMWQVNPGVVTWDQLRINRTFALAASQQYNTTHDGVLASTINAVTFTSFQKTAENETVYQNMLTTLDQWINSTTLTSLQKKQYDIQKRWMNEGSVPGMEIVMIPSGGLTRTRPANETSYITVAAVLQHPFSRGSVHINSSDPLVLPAVDPKYLTSPFDTAALVQGVQFVNRLLATEPLASLITTRIDPATNFTTAAHFEGDPFEGRIPGLSWGDTDHPLQSFRALRASLQSIKHPVGTCAMAPKELGGVVDSSLKVWGTANVRVVDASIMPHHVAAHTQSTVYAIGDKAAAIILSGSRTGNTNGAGAIGFSVVVQTVLSMAVVLGLVSGLF